MKRKDLLLALVEENTRYKAALQNLKLKIKTDKECHKDRKALLNEKELNEVLEIAGLLDKEVTAITFDNVPNEVAYEP